MAPIALTPEQKAALKAAGFGDAAIRMYETGAADAVLRTRMGYVLGGVSGGLGGSATGALSNNAPTSPTGGAPLFGRIVRGAAGTIAANIPDLSPVFTGLGKIFDNGGTSGKKEPNSQGTYSSIPDYGVYERNSGYPQAGRSNSTLGAPKAGKGPGSPSVLGAPKQGGASAGAAMPGMPEMANYAVPTLEMHDFTEQAKKIAADAFAPYLAAFDIARTNAQAQGQTSKAATKGLYDNFVKDIAAKAAETAQRYDQTKAEQAARGQAQQADIAENQQSANANVGNQLAALGLDTSAPTVLQQGANDQAYAQDQAASATESQQQFYDTQKLAQGDYDTQFGLLQQKAGIGAQGDIDSQLMNILSGIDINKANASGEQSTTALSLAQKLADRDYQMQMDQAGLGLQGAQFNNQIGQQGYENQLGQWDRTNALDQQAWERQQQEWENIFNTKKWETEATAGQDAAPFDISNYPGASRPGGVILRDTGDQNKADQATQTIANEWQNFKQMPGNGVTAVDTPQEKAQKFAIWMTQFAKKAGILESTMRDAALEYVKYVEGTG